MKILAAFALACLAAGCASWTAPQEILAESRNAPLEVARCVAANIEKYNPFPLTRFTARWTVPQEPGAYWVTADARWTVGNSGTATAFISPAGNGGSSIVIRQLPEFAHRDMKAKMIEGC